MERRARLQPSDLPPVYAIADAGVLGGVDRLSWAATTMVRAGLPWVQLRAKTGDDAALCRQIGDCVRQLADRPEAALWINDRADLACLYRAGGVHLGQHDLPPSAARRLVGESCWIGRSTHDLQQVEIADRDPAVDVIAFGPIFSTRSKQKPDPEVGVGRLADARSRTSKPLLAIGGIDASKVAAVLAAGADCAVILSALCEGDVEANCLHWAALARDLSSQRC